MQQVSPSEATAKAELVSQVLELQNTLDGTPGIPPRIIFSRSLFVFLVFAAFVSVIARSLPCTLSWCLSSCCFAAWTSSVGQVQQMRTCTDKSIGLALIAELSQRVDSVKDQNLNLKKENVVRALRPTTFYHMHFSCPLFQTDPSPLLTRLFFARRYSHSILKASWPPAPSSRRHRRPERPQAEKGNAGRSPKYRRNPSPR